MKDAASKPSQAQAAADSVLAADPPAATAFGAHSRATKDIV